MPSISLTAVAVGASVVGTAITAYSAIQSGEAQSREASYQAAVARNNQTIAEQNAQYATKAANEKAAEESLANANKEGAMRAAIAANNVDVNQGSAVDVQSSQREVDKLDTLTTLNNAMLTAYGYRSEASNYGAQSGLYSMEAGQARLAGDLGAAGSIAGNASNLAFKWGALNSATPALNPSQSQYLANPYESAAGT